MHKQSVDNKLKMIHDKYGISPCFVNIAELTAQDKPIEKF